METVTVRGSGVVLMAHDDVITVIAHSEKRKDAENLCQALQKLLIPCVLVDNAQMIGNVDAQPPVVYKVINGVAFEEQESK